MPHRRKPHKGSFGGHFDELVTHFPADERKQHAAQERHSDGAEERSVHDRLFDRAWSHKEEERRS